MQHQWQVTQHKSSMRVNAARTLSSSTCNRPQVCQTCQRQRVHHSQQRFCRTTAAPAHATEAASTNSTAIQLSRLQRFQHILGDIPAQQQQQQYGTFTPEDLAGKPQSTKKPKAAGFGSTKSSGNAWQQQQAAQRVQVKPQDSCPCKSGLQYQACCQPFLSGQLYPRSAPELARARITATLTGDVEYLVATTHPESTLALGGSRDLARRNKKQVALFRESKPAVVGMAHCRGDTDGTWLVLAILQATAGEFKGTKAPAMYLMAKRGSGSSSSSRTSSQPQTGDSSSSSGSGKSASDWLYMGQTNQAPQHEDAEAIWQLLQMHVPELLSGGGVDSSSSSSSSSSMISQEVYFVWAPPALGLPTAPETVARGATQVTSSSSSSGSNDGSSNSSSGGWYLDLLQPAVEPLQARGSGSSNSSTGCSSRSRGGVISMDAIIEARKQPVKS